MKSEEHLRIREGESDRFPLGSGGSEVWCLGIDSNWGLLEFRATKIGMQNLRDFCQVLSMPATKGLLMGVWHGQYRTDLFILDPKVILERLGDRTP